MPRAIFDKLPLKPETRRVLEHAVTGPLSPGTHGWDKEHKAYNKAVKNLWDEFLKRQAIIVEEMTSGQASHFLDEVRHSNNPVIRDFNARLRP